MVGIRPLNFEPIYHLFLQKLKSDKANSLVRREWKQISMTMGQLKQIYFVLLLGISLFIPLFLAYSLYVDLSGTVIFSSDMSFEDPGDEYLSTCQNEFKRFVPTLSSNTLAPWTHFGRESSLLSSPLTPYTQITPVLRC